MNDTTYEALANERRREVLIELLDQNPRSDGVAGPTATSRDQRDTEPAGVELYHVHLPKLESYGLIEWHRDSSEIVKGPRFEEARPLVELAADLANS